MDWRLQIAVLTARFVNWLCQTGRLGAGATWSGEIALRLEPQIIEKLIAQLEKNRQFQGAVLIAGTNGKTTTAQFLSQLLGPEKVIHNQTGANLLNGLASSLSLNYQRPKIKAVIFEVDEAVLPLVLKKVRPKAIIVLNLFRDQLDRYGEVNTLARRWKEALTKLGKETVLVLNADDPQVAFLGEGVKVKTLYFGYSAGEKAPKTTRPDLWGDSFYCPRCQNRLFFSETYFSHLGRWSCRKCGLKQPGLALEVDESFSSLSGIYNQYNAAAAIVAYRLFREHNQKQEEKIRKDITAAFGRQETLTVDGKKIVILLSKNPTGFNENLRFLQKNKARLNLLLLLNDRIPDGRDVSWIWDVDFENGLRNFSEITVSGDRVYDLALRLKYALAKPDFRVEPDLAQALKTSLKKTATGDVLYILATYSAMLEVRKILLGRKIL